MLNSATTQSSTSPARSHSGTKRPYPSDETDAVRPYKNSLPRIDRPSQKSPVDSSPVRDREERPPRNSSTIFPSFRSVSACHRCRNRKNRCDQQLPSCHLCEKAGVPCIGFDPITKREIPRSYVYFLESRVNYLEKLLGDNGIEFAPPKAHEGETKAKATAYSPSADSTAGEDSQLSKRSGSLESPGVARSGTDIEIKNEEKQAESQRNAVHANVQQEAASDHKRRTPDSNRGLDNLVSKIGMVPVHGASDSRYLGSTSGISFARVVFAAVRSSVSSSTSERGAMRPSSRRASTAPGNHANSMRDSFFGLQARPSMNRAPFPDCALARRLANLYFEHANPQAPILHRVEFMELFERVYSTEEKARSSRDLYTLNIVCAIGAGIIYDVKRDEVSSRNEDRPDNDTPSSLNSEGQDLPSGHQYQPEEYHASAILHLESCFSSPSAADGFIGGLEELQAVLLLASFALLRPVAPGLWYIVGVAVRLAIDLGLHHEDGTGLDFVDENLTSHQLHRRESVKSGKGQASEASLGKHSIHARERGRREWIRDLRRRLWWSAYSFDRLVSTCVGRPFGISDEVITTEFPSLLDDKYITKAGFLTPPPGENASYKQVSYHYFKFRLLQSEIQQVLQYQQANMARRSSTNRNNVSSTKMDLPSPFLQKFGSFRSWRQDVHRRLDEWMQSAPSSEIIGVKFSVEFLELNYWQALTMLYRQSLVVPAPLAADLNQAEHVMSPSLANIEDSEDEDDIYAKVAEAGQRTLRLYRQLHRVRLVNYTYLATHHLFMAGISFLYAIWHSPVVRSRLTLDDVDFTVLGAISVLEDLMEKCPPAEACRDVFERMSKATVQMCLSTTGFGLSSRTGEDPSIIAGKSGQGPKRQGDAPRIPTGLRVEPDTSPNIQSTVTAPIPCEARGPDYHDVNHDPRLLPNSSFPSNSMSPTEYPRNYHDQHTSKQFLPQPPPITDRASFNTMQQHLYTNSSTSAHHQQESAYVNPFTTQSPLHAYSAPPQTYLPDLDFLNFDTRLDHEQLYAASTGIDLDTFPISSPFGIGGGSSDTGVDLGFGMTVGLQHDWSEGAGYGLFGEFFFGNGAAGN
ncbi:conserved hypothetical protein [Uncinocarpus reesii 1704]|uniref:Zn(2)-C6 fungal-type domain-containing protein n=1 Tax=Uncinocarpus reesii (strain UAMH 1704) TaxID=336963 RepID=C4JYB2_UNCRE|nr:uncharacterized protein UREG_07163 [Uncinocarpus reesii 1704]EEP82298.1 conserved hypothetical protein [Uncinocarpus reesii 1704]